MSILELRCNKFYNEIYYHNNLLCYRVSTERRVMAKEVSQEKLKKLLAENKALKEENARLKRSGKTSPNKPTRQPIKATLSVLLISFSIVFVLIANIFLWAGNTLFNTDNFTKAVDPVIEQPVVQSAIADYATTELFNNVDVEAYVADALPERIAFLAPQLTQQINTQTKSVLTNVIASDRFQTTWKEVTQKQHERLLTFIKNYQGDGVISVNDLFGQLQTRLSDTSLSFLSNKQLPSRVGDITVANVPQLPVLHEIANNLGLIRWGSVVLAVVTLLAGIFLSKNRRKSFYIFASGVIVAMLSTLIALRVLQAGAASSVQPQYAEAVRTAAEIISSGLRTQSVLIASFMFVMVAIIWVSGNSRRALALKSIYRQGLVAKLHDKLLGSKRSSRLINWVRKYRRGIEWSVFIVSTLILLMVKLSLASMIWWLVSLLVIVGVVELIAGDSSQ